MLFLLKWWNDFFHSRTKSPGVFCGYLRIWYAVLILCDRLLLTLDFHWFFLSGIMPCKQHYTFRYEDHYIQHSGNNYPMPPSLLCYIAGNVSPDYSPYVFWGFHLLGMLNAVLLLLGVYPKLQLVLLHINMLSFHYHSDLMWDGEDTMFILWNFLFLFLPLHQVTIYDQFHGLFSRRKFFPEDHRDWPMWPFRLWQLELCFIYLGAGYTKLATETWSSGNALYHIIHTKDFFGGPVVPDFIFNRRGPLHLMTLSSLVVECLCIFFIWPLATRNITLVAIFMLHVGIDLAMNMHCFEWMSILGWLFFLVQRERPPNDKKATVATTTSPSTVRRLLVNVFVFFIITIFFVDSVPLSELSELIPLNRNNFISSTLTEWNQYRQSVLDPKFFEPFIHPLGLYQGVWNLFTGTSDHNYRYEVQVRLLNGTEVSAHISPDWGTMTWYEKKRWQRPMSFYVNFESSGCHHCYAQYYVSQLGVPKEDLASASIISTCQFPPESPPPENIWDWDWFFSPAKQPLIHLPEKTIFTLNFCDDLEDDCEVWATRDGLCESDDDAEIYDMTLQCRRSCHFCHHDPDQLDVGSNISLYFSEPEHYFDATVLSAKVSHLVQRYLLQYDGYETTEWTTAMALRQKGVHILRASPSLDDTIPPSLADHVFEEVNDLASDESEPLGEDEESVDGDEEIELEEEDVESEEEVVEAEEAMNDEL